MRYINAFFMCFGMFSAIPCPYRPWDEKARNLMLMFLPMIGLIIGIIWFGIYTTLIMLDIPLQLQAAILMLYPYVITGFLHLDGFMDTSDAILSRRPLEEKLRILKDPHAGAFAIISLAVLFILCYAAMSEVLYGLNRQNIYVFILIPSITRVCSALAVMRLKPLGHSQYSGEFRKSSTSIQTVTVILMGMIVFGIGYVICTSYSASFNSIIIILLTTIFTYIAAAAYSNHQLGGMSGDLAGYALTIAEAGGIIAMAII